MPSAVVFLGPTMPVAEACGLLPDAGFLPPIRRGDLDRLSPEVHSVGILDGEFFQSLSISPKEVLRALRRGIQIYGASSMGALRAAETHTFGTQGIGRVFAMFRDEVLDADDEVALAYEPGTYRPLSAPLVNLREALALAAHTGHISPTTRDDLVQQMKSTYFPLRSWHTLEMLCPALRLFAQTHTLPDIKRDDARELLLSMHTAQQPCLQHEAEQALA